MTQEAVAKTDAAEISATEPPKRIEKKQQVNSQEIIESLKAAGDDIGQISELSSEEKLLVAQFFQSLLKLMAPLTPSIAVSTSVLPLELGDAIQAHLDPTGHLALIFGDGHMELKDLSETKNRDLMMTVVAEVLPKFKGLTSQARRKVETRIKFLTSLTKEMQKSSDALTAVMTEPQK